MRPTHDSVLILHHTPGPLHRIILTTLSLVALACCQCEDLQGFESLYVVATTTPTGVNFGNAYVGSTARERVTLKATGNRAMLVLAINISHSDFSVTHDTLPLSVEPGRSAILDVSFAPTLDGSRSGELNIQTNADEGGELQVSLRGDGVEHPPCDDGNPCTTDSFDLEAQHCVHAPTHEFCDDGSACTTNDRCDNGTCVGEAISCADSITCTVDGCDPELGCRFLPDDSVCSDDDPCTLDVCGLEGCENPTAPNGTLCGTLEACVSVQMCLLGECTTVGIPDGTPCNDSNVCTQEDVCVAGICQGASADIPPEIVAEDFLYAPAFFSLPYTTSSFQGAYLDNALYVSDGISLKTAVLTEGALRVVGATPGVNAGPLVPISSSTRAVATMQDTKLVLLDTSVPQRPTVVAQTTLGNDGAATITVDGERVLACVLDFYVDTANDSTLVSIPLEADGFGLVEELDPEVCDVQRGAVALEGNRLARVPRRLGWPGDEENFFELWEIGTSEPALLGRISVDDLEIPEGVIPGPFTTLDLRGDHAVGFTVDTWPAGRVALWVDLRSVEAPRATVIPVGSGQFLGHFDSFLLGKNDEGLFTMDMSDPLHPGVPVPQPGSLDRIVASSNTHLFATSARQLIAVPRIGGELFTPLPSIGNGSIDVLWHRAGGVVAVSPYSFISQDVGNGWLSEPSTTMTSLLGAITVIKDTSEVMGVFAPIRGYPPPGCVVTASPFGFCSRRQNVTVDGTDSDVQRLSVSSDGTSTFEDHLPVSMTQPTVSLHAMAFWGCMGSAVARASDGTARISVVSACSGTDSVGMVELSSIPITLAPGDSFTGDQVTDFLSVAHAEGIVSIANRHTVRLVNYKTALWPRIAAEIDIADLEHADDVSMGYDAGVWVVVLSDGVFNGVPVESRLLVYDVDESGASLRWSQVLYPGYNYYDKTRRRVLAMAWPLAYIGYHAGSDDRTFHQLMVFDVSGGADDALVQTIDLPSEPVSALVDENRLIIGRVDGLTVVAPPCGL
jgi:hypothetical protein